MNFRPRCVDLVATGILHFLPGARADAVRMHFKRAVFADVNHRPVAASRSRARRLPMKRIPTSEAIITVALLVMFALVIWFGAMP